MSDNAWYAWYPGDYRAKSHRLSLLEKGAYRELLDEYYAMAEALPEAMPQLWRICGAITDEEKQAVSTVLSVYFVLKNNKYHNKRADREIEKRRNVRKQLSDRGKLGAKRRWDATAIFPPNAQAMAITTTTTTVHQNQEDTLSRKVNGTDTKEILEFLNTTAGKRFRPSKVNLDLIRCRLESGITPEQLRKIIVRKSRDWLPDEKMRNYLRPSTLFGRTQCEQYLGELVPPSEEKHEL